MAFFKTVTSPLISSSLVLHTADQKINLVVADVAWNSGRIAHSGVPSA